MRLKTFLSSCTFTTRTSAERCVHGLEEDRDRVEGWRSCLTCRPCKKAPEDQSRHPHGSRGIMGNHLSDLAPPGSFLPGFKCLHVVVIGLDSAGKTSLLYRLKLKEFVETIPTKGFNTEKVKVSVGGSRAVTFHVWDVGGQEKLRPLWKSYTRRTDGLVFVVDAAETERMEEAKVELHKISRSSENQGVPVLILANKQDLETALPVGQVEKLLGVQELSAGTLHHVHSCSAVDGRGVQQGLEKLYDMILRRKKMVKHSRGRRR